VRAKKIRFLRRNFLSIHDILGGERCVFGARTAKGAEYPARRKKEGSGGTERFGRISRKKQIHRKWPTVGGGGEKSEQANPFTNTPKRGGGKPEKKGGGGRPPTGGGLRVFGLHSYLSNGGKRKMEKSAPREGGKGGGTGTKERMFEANSCFRKTERSKGQNFWVGAGYGEGGGSLGERGGATLKRNRGTEFTGVQVLDTRKKERKERN